MENLLLRKIEISHSSQALLYKHNKTHEMSLWQDYFSVDKNWISYNLYKKSNFYPENGELYYDEHDESIRWATENSDHKIMLYKKAELVKDLNIIKEYIKNN